MSYKTTFWSDRFQPVQLLVLALVLLSDLVPLLSKLQLALTRNDRQSDCLLFQKVQLYIQLFLNQSSSFHFYRRDLENYSSFVFYEYADRKKTRIAKEHKEARSNKSA